MMGDDHRRDDVSGPHRSDRRVFSVVVSFDDGWWKADVRDFAGVVSHTSELSMTDAAVREAIGWALGIDPGSFDLDLIVDHPRHSARTGRAT